MDNEIKGEGNQYDYGMRIYDPRVGRFLSVDPLTDKYPWYTPYQFAGNKPIWCIDLDGLEDIPMNGGNYYSVEMLKQMAFKDIRVQKAIERGERVLLKQSYSVTSNGQRNPVARQIVLNEGTAGSNISAYNQDGSFYESGALGTAGLTQTFNPSVGLFQPTPPMPEPPEMPQAPPNPPLPDVTMPTTPNTGQKKKPAPPQHHHGPKAKPPIANPRKPETPAAPPPAVGPPPPEVPPAAPNPDDFCLACFNGTYRTHYVDGIRGILNWLRSNPNYNLRITPDGGAFFSGWDAGIGTFGGGPTFRQRAQTQFALIQGLLKRAGIDPERIKLTLGRSTGTDLKYSVEKKPQ